MTSEERKIYSKQYYIKNREQKLEAAKQYQKEHKNQRQKYIKNYNVTHKKQICITQKKYYTEHQGIINEYRRKWQSSDHASVYEIVNLLTNKKYIGSTTMNPKQRWYHHKVNIEKYPCRPLYRDMLELGLDNFKLEVLFTCPKDQARKAEQFIMDSYGGELYNQVRAFK